MLKPPHAWYSVFYCQAFPLHSRLLSESVVRRGSYRARLEILPLPRITRRLVSMFSFPIHATLEIVEIVDRRVPMDCHLIGLNPIAHEMGIPESLHSISRIATIIAVRQRDNDPIALVLLPCLFDLAIATCIRKSRNQTQPFPAE